MLAEKSYLHMYVQVLVQMAIGNMFTSSLAGDAFQDRELWLLPVVLLLVLL